MSDETKKGLSGFLDSQMTRRQFLKISGKSIAGLTVSATMLSLFGCTQQQVDSSQIVTWAMPQGLLVVNAAKCTGCKRCEINCSLFNDQECSSYISRVKISRKLHIHGKDGLLMGNFNYSPDTCRQCEVPACGEACQKQAIFADEQGIKRVDPEKCIGCGDCVEACPWHMPTVNPATNKSGKCIACGACVQGCPTGALAVIPWDSVTAAAQEIVA